MVIEIKFDLGQKVYLRKGSAYYLWNNEKDKVISGVVTGFLIRGSFIEYEIDRGATYLGRFSEKDIFSTKEEVSLQGKTYPTTTQPRVPPLNPNAKPNFKNIFNNACSNWTDKKGE